MSSDQDRARSMFRFLCPSSHQMHVVIIDGTPMSKARPRFRAGGQVFASDAQIEAERALGWRFKDAFREPLTGNLAVGCIFFRPNRHRIDVDNMLKHVMDSANAIVWQDDSQVTAQLGIVEVDAERPRTVIVIGEHASTMDRSEVAVRTRVCPQCGVSFTSKQMNPKFCSRRCASLSRGQDLSAEVPCAWCGTEFRRQNAGARFCSDECRLSSLNAPNRGRPVPTCADCGKRLSKRGYRQCRACWSRGNRT